MTRNRVPAWLFALVGTVVVAMFAFMAWSNWSNDRALSERGVETTARVVEVGKRTEVEFSTADGRRVRALVGQGDSGSRATVGDEIPIAYDPRNPGADVRDTRVEENHTVAYILAGLALIGAVAVAHAVVVAVRSRRRSRAAG